MTSSADPILKIELQGAGDNPGSWHTPLNGALSQMIEGFCQKTAVSMSAGSVILTDTQYVSNQSRSAGFSLTGTLTANRTVTAPDREKVYYICDDTAHAGFTLGFVVSGGRTLYLNAGHKYIVALDGAGGYDVVAHWPGPFATLTGTNTLSGSIGYTVTAFIGLSIDFVNTTANSTAVTVAFDDAVAKTVSKNGSTALVSGDLAAGMAGRLVYDGTRFQLIPSKVATVFGIADGGTQTTDFGATVNTRYIVDCDGGTVTVTMPASATAGDVIILAKFGTSAMTVNWNGLKFNGATTTLITSDEGISTLIYTGADRGWVEG